MNRRGQALIETAAFFFAVAVLLGGYVGFTRWFAVRQKLMLAAREGALLYSSGHWTRQEVESRMRDYLVTGTLPFSPQAVHVSVGPKAGLAYRLMGLDESTASYQVPGGWHRLLGADSKVSETFIVKHASPYWAPLQPWGGPAVPYGR